MVTDPEPGDPGLRAWAALLRVHADLVPRLSRRVDAEGGIPLSWYDVLLELAVEPAGRLRIQDLGERVVLSRSRVSRVVDDLAGEGLVVREPDPTDGRASLATLTAAGRAAFDRARPVYLAAIDDLFTSRLPPGDRSTVAVSLERVLTHRPADDA